MRVLCVLFFCYCWIFCTRCDDTPGDNRPDNKRPAWYKAVSDVMIRVAIDNSWSWDGKINFHKSHAMPWQQISKKLSDYSNSKISAAEMRNFIKDLSTPHKDAAFFQNMKTETREKYLKLNRNMKEGAMSSFDEFQRSKNKQSKTQLAKYLHNMPANVFPGDPSKNMAVGKNFDPPRKGIPTKDGRFIRTNEATDHSKEMMKKYKIPEYTKNNKPVRSDRRGGCSARKRRSLSGGCGKSKDKDTKSKAKRKLKNILKKGSTKIRKGMKKFFRKKGKMNLKVGMIDLTGDWIPKHKEHSSTSGIDQPKAGIDNNDKGSTLHASAGSVHGHIESGYSKAGGKLRAGVKTYVGKEGVNAEVKLPSGYASSHGVGVGGDLSLKAEATFKKDSARVGVSGPGGNFHLGPISGGIGVGLGAEASADIKKGIGAKVDTPAGSYGAKVGCVTEVCFIGCFSVKIC